MPLLESLDISGCIWDEWDFYHRQNDSRNRLRLLTNSLAKISPDNRLITVDLELGIDDFEQIRDAGFEDAGWEDFCRVVGNLANKVANMSVRLVVSCPFGRRTQDFLQNRMRPLGERAIVVSTNEDYGTEGIVYPWSSTIHAHC